MITDPNAPGDASHASADAWAFLLEKIPLNWMLVW